MVTELAGLALLLTGDRDAAEHLVHTALTRSSSARKPDEHATIAALAQAWLSGGQPVGEPPELPDELEPARRSLDALPEDQRLTVVLHHWSGRTVPEIAALLGRPEEEVEAGLAAGVAELYLPVPTVARTLAALVAAAGPLSVDVDRIRASARRHRRRAAVVAAGVLVAAGVGAAVLTSEEPAPASSRDTPVRVVTSYGGVPEVVDFRSLRLTAELHTAGVLPTVTGRTPRFTRQEDHTYSASAVVGTTQLVFFVRSQPGVTPAMSLCTDTAENCTNREFPDGTRASVLVTMERPSTGLSLTALRPDDTIVGVYAVANGPEPLEVGLEDMFRFATVFSY